MRSAIYGSGLNVLRKMISCAVLAGMCVTALGQDAGAYVSEISVDARTTFHQQTTGGVYDSHFQGDYFNFHILGQFSDRLTYRVRQRLNKEIDVQNPFNATDFLWLSWKATEHWSLTGGKQAILIGGYEIDSPPIDVYYYGAFSNRLYQYYAFGATLTYSFAEGQDLSIQFCPSPISPGTQDAYSYNLYWGGRVIDGWKTTWSYNFVEDEFSRKMHWIVLGNKFFFGDLVVDVDFINRASARQKRFLFSDMSVITKAIWTVGKWNLCTKFGYEFNDAENMAPDGKSWDLVLPAGNDYLYGGAGVEYFPLGNDRVRLHAVYFRDNHDHVNNFDIGLTWRFDILRRQPR